MLVAGDLRTLTKLVLVPVRLLFTAATGRIASNQAAAALYLSQRDAPATSLVTAALGWRTTPPIDRRAAAELLRAELLPLYRHYVDAYANVLRSVANAPLARQLERVARRLGD